MSVVASPTVKRMVHRMVNRHDALLVNRRTSASSVTQPDGRPLASPHR